MLIGGFLDGRLIYIFSFKFNSEEFLNRIQEQLQRNFPDGDEVNKYLRSASFSLNAYKNSADLEVKVFVNESEQESCRKNLTKGVYDLLRQNL